MLFRNAGLGKGSLPALKLQRQLANAERQIKELLDANPAPTVENVQMAQNNAQKLQARLQSIRQNLKRGSLLTISNDGVRVMSGLQRYISNYQRQVVNHLNMGDNWAFFLP